MGVFERIELSAKKRSEWSAAHNVVAEQLHGRAITGVLFLGAEVGQRPRDSVYVVTTTGAREKVAEDWGEYKRAVSRALGYNPNADDWLRGVAVVTQVATAVGAGVLYATGLGAGAATALVAAGQVSSRALRAAALDIEAQQAASGVPDAELELLTLAEHGASLATTAVTAAIGRAEVSAGTPRPPVPGVTSEEPDRTPGYLDPDVWAVSLARARGREAELVEAVFARIPPHHQQLAVAAVRQGAARLA